MWDSESSTARKGGRGHKRSWFIAVVLSLVALVSLSLVAAPANASVGSANYTVSLIGDDCKLLHVTGSVTGDTLTGTQRQLSWDNTDLSAVFDISTSDYALDTTIQLESYYVPGQRLYLYVQQPAPDSGVAAFGLVTLPPCSSHPPASTPTLHLESVGTRDCTPTEFGAGGTYRVGVTIDNVEYPASYILRDQNNDLVYQDDQAAVIPENHSANYYYVYVIDALNTGAYQQTLIATREDAYNPSNVVTVNVPACQEPTPTPTATVTPSPTATATPSPTATATPSPTQTPNQAPKAVLTYGPIPAYAPVLVTLSGGLSSDDKGIVRWDFICGNGQRFSQSGATASHVQCDYTKAARYKASVTVYDEQGLFNTASKVITVGSHIPPTFVGETITQARSRLYARGIHPGDNIGVSTPPAGYRYSFAYYAFHTSAGYPKVLPGRAVPYGTEVTVVARLIRA